jgi:hypothetical protein
MAVWPGEWPGQTRPFHCCGSLSKPPLRCDEVARERDDAANIGGFEVEGYACEEDDPTAVFTAIA